MGRIDILIKKHKDISHLLLQGGVNLKTFVLDTNVLLYDPNCLKSFKKSKVVIPLPVLDELDNAKSRMDSVGRNARAVIRVLDELRKSGSLSIGVIYEDTIVRVEQNHKGNTPDMENSIDNRILSTAIGLGKTETVVVITKDINLRVKCDALGVTVEDYESGKLAEDPISLYKGYRKLSVPSFVINDIYSCGSAEYILDAYPNEYFILTAEDNFAHSALARYNDGIFYRLGKNKLNLGVKPRNAEQQLALDLILNDDIKLVTLIGIPGGGKTLLALAGALEKVLYEQRYKRLLVARPVQPMGKDLGYLPGSMEEKLNPWMQPIDDNLEHIFSGDRGMVEMHKRNGEIQVEALTYIRGRSIPNSLIIIDEAQNLTAHEVKTIITRVGEDSKIIMTGDLNQIDVPYLDFSDSGLTHAVERFKDYDIAGHMSLPKGERSELATLASKVL